METPTATRPERDRRRRSLGVYLLVASLLLLSFTALYGGAALVAAPDGSFVDAVVPVDLSHLEGTPFTDYTMPGLILVVALGVVPLVAAYGAVRRAPWAWLATLGSGVLLLGWLLVEYLLLGYFSPLQPAYAVFGLLLLTLALTPAVRTHLRAPGAAAT
jgi:uncharacterized BrkB/YihY/UPF0761 family membrane protein